MKLGDDFLRIPKLDVSGSNWVIFKDRFLWSVDAHGLTEHVDGTSQSPKDPLTSLVRLGVLSDASCTEVVRQGMEEGSKGMEPRRSNR